MNLSPLFEELDVELSGHCNADCVFCPRDKMTRAKSIMSRAHFDTLLRELAQIDPDGPSWVFFCGFGEPLINKNAAALVDAMGETFPDALISLVTNGGLLDEETCDSLLNGGLTFLSCSMQSVEREAYQSAMPGPDFDKVTGALQYLAEKRWETGVQVSVTYVRMEQSDAELAAYRAFWDRLGIRVGEIPLINRGGYLKGEKVSGTGVVRSCSLFERRLFVAANGDVLACCQDLNGESRLGTIGVDPLKTILERKAARIAEGRLFAMCSACNDPGAVRITEA